MLVHDEILQSNSLGDTKQLSVFLVHSTGLIRSLIFFFFRPKKKIPVFPVTRPTLKK